MKLETFLIFLNKINKINKQSKRTKNSQIFTDKLKEEIFDI